MHFDEFSFILVQPLLRLKSIYRPSTSEINKALEKSFSIEPILAFHKSKNLKQSNHKYEGK